MLVRTSQRAKKLLKCQDIIVYNGLPVMACVTREALQLYNSELWSVEKWNDSDITLVSFDELDEKRTTVVDTETFADMFRPAYARTAHRVQGATIRAPYSIYDWNRMEERMKYVALSRGTSISNVNIMI